MTCRRFWLPFAVWIEGHENRWSCESQVHWSIMKLFLCVYVLVLVSCETQDWYSCATSDKSQPHQGPCTSTVQVRDFLLQVAHQRETN